MFAAFRERVQPRHVTLLLSLIIGALVGLVVVAFILITGRLTNNFYPHGSDRWRRIVIPVVGSLVTGFLLSRYFPNARGSGIPQTKFALFINEGVIRFRTVLGKFLCCSLSLASGMALGREGPSVHIGAGLASLLGRRAGLPPDEVKALIPVGSTAALAAAFNTPIAAVLFSLEEILGDMHAPVLGTAVISAATSWVVLHLILGDEPLFHVPSYQLVHPLEFGVYAVLGVVGGLASVLFVKLLLDLRRFFLHLPKSTVWLQPVAGGLVVGLLGLFMPEVLGVGYGFVERVLGGDMALRTVAILALFKIAATASGYASGNAGGIFGPSLFIGAMVGGTVGSVAHILLPGYTANPGAYALVGMGTAFAGIVRTPLTSVIMIFEMTRDYSIIVPLMISNLIAFFVSARLQREPIYEALAHQEGVFLPAGEAREHLARLRVSDVMESGPTIPGTSAVAGLPRGGWKAFPVTDNGTIIGILKHDSSARAGPKTTAAELADREYPYVHPDHPFSLALERMGANQLDLLPVVSRANIYKLLGVVTLSSILKSYGLEIALPDSTEAL